MGFFDLFRKKEPVREQARRFARLLVKHRRKHPDKPLRDGIKPAASALRAMFRKDVQRQALEFLISDQYQVESVEEVCTAIVALVTDTPMDASERYQELVRAVKEEVAAAEAAG